MNQLTTTRDVVDNVKEYIVNHYDGENYELPETTDFATIAINIWTTWKAEKRYTRYSNDVASFIDWCQGLPSIIDTCYYYNRSAIDDLGNILGQTEKQRKEYTEPQAEERLTRLIYRELSKVARKVGV